jgi:hypothetical protein
VDTKNNKAVIEFSNISEEDKNIDEIKVEEFENPYDNLYIGNNLIKVSYYYCSAIGNKENKEKMISFLKEYKECKSNNKKNLPDLTQKISFSKSATPEDLDKVKQSLYNIIEKDDETEKVFDMFYLLITSSSPFRIFLEDISAQIENILNLKNFVFVDFNDVKKGKISGIIYKDDEISYEIQSITNLNNENKTQLYSSIFSLGVPIMIGYSNEKKQLKMWQKKIGEIDISLPTSSIEEKENKYLLEDPLFIVLHETIESYLVTKLEIYGPYERWFTEGVANFLAYEIIKEVKGNDYAKNTPYSLESIDKEYSKYRKKVNLPNWLAVTYERMYDKDIDKELTTAHYAYATQLIANFFKNKDNVKKVLYELKNIEGPKDTLIIDNITQQLFSKSIKEELYKYKSTKTLTEEEENKYIAKIEKELSKENIKFLKIKKICKKVIESNPYNYKAHLYYTNALYHELQNNQNNEDSEELQKEFEREWNITAFFTSSILNSIKKVVFSFDNIN